MYLYSCISEFVFTLKYRVYSDNRIKDCLKFVSTPYPHCVGVDKYAVMDLFIVVIGSGKLSNGAYFV